MDATFVLMALLGLALVVAGFAGLVLPVLPGIPLVFAGLVVFAWMEDFAYVGAATLVILGLLALASYGIDFLASALGAKKFGASSRAIWGAALGALVGIFFGLPGLVFGPFLGAVTGEFTARATWQKAVQAGFGATVGLIFGALLKIALAFAMVGTFILARLIG